MKTEQRHELSQCSANNIIRDISLLSVYLEHLMRYTPRPKMGAVASDSDNDDDDSDGSLDILHHPGPGESLVSGLVERAGECWEWNATSED